MSRYYDQEFKDQAVELVLSSGKSIKQIAKELGCSASSLGEWKSRKQRQESALGKASITMSNEELWQHNKQLQAELKRVTQEREILKKAAAILGK